jgi:exopolysaccharide production protein ExoZ
LIGLYLLAFALRPFGALFEFVGNPLILEFLFGVGIAYAPSYKIGQWGIPIGAALLILCGWLNFMPNGSPVDYLIGNGGQ